MSATILDSMHVQRIKSNGFPLIMLHGWGLSCSQLEPLGELLSTKSNVYLIDLPGFGKSMPPDSVWSSFDYADCLVQYMDKHSIDQVDLLGHSFGGKVAMSLASRYPARVRNLILMAPSGIPRQRSLIQKCRMSLLIIAARGLKFWDRLWASSLFKDVFVPHFGSKDYQSAGVMRPILVRSVNEDLSSFISKLSHRCLIMWGQDDEDTPLEIGQRVHRLIKKSQLLIFPHKKHWIWQDVGAHLCAFHILRFLQGSDLESTCSSS